jgi:DNA replication protein DnaC
MRDKRKRGRPADLCELLAFCRSKGKTHLAIGLTNYWYAEKYKGKSLRGNALFLSAPEFVCDIRNTFKIPGNSEREILDRYFNVPLLLIDDLGSDKVSDWSRQEVYLLIDLRYRYKRQTIITSNLSLKQIAEKIDDRIGSRIAEMGVVIKLVGADHRVDYRRP